jgi:DNA-binding MarR family transcriptional regulator
MLEVAQDHDARWLRSSIRGLVRRFSISERADVSCCGVTVAQAATLEALRQEGPLRPSALCRRLGIRPSTLTRNLARLEEADLVSRMDDPNDGRARTLGLTPAGEAAAERLKAQEEAFAVQILASLDPERRERALAGLADLLAAVREATEACCPGAFEHLMSFEPRQGCGSARCDRGERKTGC